MRVYMVVLVIILAMPVTAQAQKISDCDAALVEATYKDDSNKSLDWRLARFVSESEYNKAKRGAGANATIYGVPVSASCSEFKEEASQRSEIFDAEFSRDEARNVLWTGLDPSSVSTYQACLDALVATNATGLFLEVNKATESDVSLSLKYKPGAHDPDEIPLSWQNFSKDAQGNFLPSSASNSFGGGGTTIILSRPTRAMQIAANSGNGLTSGAVVLTPLPKAAPTLPAIEGHAGNLYIKQDGIKVEYEAHDVCCDYDFTGSFVAPTLISGYEVRLNRSYNGGRCGMKFRVIIEIHATGSERKEISVKKDLVGPHNNGGYCDLTKDQWHENVRLPPY